MIPTPSDELEPHERISEEHERARVLADVLRDQDERAQAARQVQARQDRWSRTRRGVLAGAWAVAAYVWILSPGWARVEAPPVPTLTEDARSLRINLFLQSQQVEAFQETRGRLPWVLQEAGPPLPGMEYQRLDNQSYEIQARSRRVRLRYSSDRPPLSFVGDAARVLTAGQDAPSAFPEGAAGTDAAGTTEDGA